jgi:hypothetical protein
VTSDKLQEVERLGKTERVERLRKIVLLLEEMDD